MKIQRTVLWIVPLLAVLVLAGCAGPFSGLIPSKNVEAQLTTNTSTSLAEIFSPSTTSEPQGVNETTEDAITLAVGKVNPAIVFIDTTYQTVQQDDRFNFPGYYTIPQQQPQEGQGSGVIVDGGNGYLLTNNHVVKNAVAIKVTLPDGRTFTGSVVGADSLADIAVVKIDGANLPEAKLADNTNLKVGSWAIAIGNPYGFENSVTVGVVSALNRTISDPDSGNPLMDLIQTDAAINPGNSGGALVNISGEVIGINTAIIESAQGIGFAVNIDAARRSFQDIVAHGKVTRAWMGITFAGVTEEIAKQLNLTQASGALVGSVSAGGPAAKAGLLADDVIQAADGTPLVKAEELRQLILSKKAGDTLTLTVWRNGQTLSLTVTLGEMPSQVQ
ncbi:MAG: trypsin-like peptidase domain-containing protein [Coprothermobacterota bacterium]|nr:trypsin-like peptidase domain-containing protein [Coprothermobacterota bacterium]